MAEPRTAVVATAGHVDHGKSTLVRALTGIEPDRFAEERRRGLTIDLGYAWTTLADGTALAFVDVPGHQRFIANMLAGLGPAPAVLFVVAADEGWARQSAEHLAAVDALDVRHGLLAVTRSDLADPAPAITAAQAQLARSRLGVVEAVAVSGTTGAGVDDLRAALGRLTARLPEPTTGGRVRLWVDRAFTIRGSGTVVTATLGAGTIAAGDGFELGGRRVTVRTVQTMETDRPRVAAVARVALNLRGVAADEVGRGDALLTPDAWPATDVIDVRHRAADGLPAELMLHVGTAAVPVRVRPLDATHARLRLARPLPLVAGDRAVLRDPGRQTVATGALVLDADPPALARRGAAARRAEVLAVATGDLDVAAEVARRGYVAVDHLTRLGATSFEGTRRSGRWLVDETTWRGWLDRLPVLVDAWADQHPLDPAVPAAALASRLGAPDDVLPELITAVGLTSAGGRVARAGTTADLDRGAAGLRRLVERLTAEPFAAPERAELDALGLGVRELAAAERAGVLVRIAPDVVLTPAGVAAAAEIITVLPQPFTTSAARQALGTTRRVAIPLLEHLDAHGITERVDGTLRRARPAQ